MSYKSIMDLREWLRVEIMIALEEREELEKSKNDKMDSKQKVAINKKKNDKKRLANKYQNMLTMVEAIHGNWKVRLSENHWNVCGIVGEGARKCELGARMELATRDEKDCILENGDTVEIKSFQGKDATAPLNKFDCKHYEMIIDTQIYLLTRQQIMEFGKMGTDFITDKNKLKNNKKTKTWIMENGQLIRDYKTGLNIKYWE